MEPADATGLQLWNPCRDCRKARKEEKNRYILTCGFMLPFSTPFKTKGMSNHAGPTAGWYLGASRRDVKDVRTDKEAEKPC